MRYTTSCLFILLLLVPAVFGFMGNDHNQVKALKPPGLVLANFKEPEYFHSWREFLKERLAAPPQAAAVKNWLDYRLFAMTENKNIHVGRDGWLFSKEAVSDYRKTACNRQAQADQLNLEIKALARLVEAAGKRFAFAVTPSKATLYPELVGNVPVAAECGQSFLDLLIEGQALCPVKAFVRLDTTLEKAKTSGSAVFSKTRAELTAEGAQVAASTILDHLTDGEDQTIPLGDLAAVLLGRRANQGMNHESPGKTRGSGSPATALIYGGSCVGQLLPVFAAHLDRVDVIVSDTLPSLNHGENPADYEAIIVVVPETRLNKLCIDLNRLSTLLEVETLADHRSLLPLNTLRSHNRLSLKLVGQKLVVKSLGPISFFNLPDLPGTDDKTLRLLKLPISSTCADTLSWQSKGVRQVQGTGLLRPGLNKIYIPLPKGSAVQVRVNPGKHAGLFDLTEIELLEYNLDDQTMDIQGGRILSTFGGLRRDEHVQDKSGQFITIEQENKDNADNRPPAIWMNDFEDGCVIQRRGKTADIIISGSFAGNPVGIEARAVKHSSNEPVTEWIEIDGAPKEGVFMGILPDVPQGGWYRLMVRFKDVPEVMYKSRPRVGVGVLAALIGQSNMKEWFHTGSDHKADALLSLHREGCWQPEALQGNGAVAFGNRLAGYLAVPVGLLDYAVNGSGLRREADWGAGYWSDRSPEGIYQNFIRDLSAAGGVLEYVVFMQGEADAARATISENQYLETLTSFINQQIRADIVNGSQRPYLPFLIVGVPKRPIGKDLPHQAVRNAQRMAARDIPECYLAAVSLDLTNQGRQHLAPEAYTTLGRRTAQTVLYLLDEASFYQGPRVSGAHKSGLDTIDIFLLHCGGTNFSPETRISGWEALAGQLPVKIANAERLNAQTIRIRLASPVTGPLTLRYLFGAMPDAVNPVRDNSPMELPLEPYEGIAK